MPARIRSNQRRRLLALLSVSAHTVSEAASATGLRLPHASSQLKRLREEGYVAADRAGSSRGALQRLTPEGHSVLEGDELARLRDLLKEGIPVGMLGCPVARDGDTLLLAYAKDPGEGLLLIPSSASSKKEVSSGNRGASREGCWATPLEKRLRWFDCSNLTPTTPPMVEAGMGTIDGWSETSSAIGLIRARLISDNTTDLAVGTWFDPESQDAIPPLPPGLRDGPWVLGSLHADAPQAKPEIPVIAVVRERYAAAMLVDAAKDGAWVLNDSGGNSPIPVSALEPWIKEVHPRLSPAELRDRLTQVQRAALAGWRGRRRRSRLTTTWQRFRESWGETGWCEDEELGKDGSFDISTFDSSAIRALSHWVLNETTSPLVLDWPGHMAFDEAAIQHMIGHGSIRLLLVPSRILSRNATLTESDSGWPRSLLDMGDGSRLPLRLEERDEKPVAVPTTWEIPQSPSDLVRPTDGVDTRRDPTSQNEAVWISSSIFPDGDGDFANRVETSYPLAAWIASPPEERWGRWQRISGVLEDVWLDLLEPERVPFTELFRMLRRAGSRWRGLATPLIRRKVMENPDLLMQMRRLCRDDSDSAACAEQVLSCAPWVIPRLGRGMARWALESWEKAPTHDVETVLEGLVWLQRSGFIPRTWVDRLRVASDSLRSGHPLRDWNSILNWSIDDRAIRLDTMRRAIENLPLDWWADVSTKVLSRQLDDEEGRVWLLKTPIPWAAATFRPPGSDSMMPGNDSTHPGMNSELVTRIRSQLTGLTSDDGPGSAHILDLVESIEDLQEGVPPRCGRTHPGVAWLCRPIEEWVNNLMFRSASTIDPDVDERYRMGISGFHEDLLKSSQRTL